MHSLLEPLVIGRLNTKKGPREVVIEAGSSDNVYALDAKTGELLWKHHFDSTFHEEPGARASVLCPGGMTANVTIGPEDGPGKYIIYAAAWDGRLHMSTPPTARNSRANQVHATERQAVRAESGEQCDLHA